ncbi:MAG: hypothetical protein ACR2MO_08495 [Acidimicrobiales bacterium]
MEEAAELLRVGRTKAYAMAKEWRASGGLSGLPVIDLGNTLRVPLWRIEAMVGAELRALPSSATAGASDRHRSSAAQPAPMLAAVRT